MKYFLYIDKSGRGFTATYSYKDLVGWSGLNNTNDDGISLSLWIEDCGISDKFKTNSIEIICIQ